MLLKCLQLLLIALLLIVYGEMSGVKCQSIPGRPDRAKEMIIYGDVIVLTRNFETTCFLKKEGENYKTVYSIFESPLNYNCLEDIALSGHVLIELKNTSIRFFDIKDVANPRYLNCFRGFLEYGRLLSITVDGRIAYLTDRYNGLYMVDVGDPNAIKILDRFSSLEDPGFRALTYQNLVLIADSNGLKVLERTSEDKLRLVKKIDQKKAEQVHMPTEDACECDIARDLSYTLLRENDIVYAANNKTLVTYRISPTLDVTKCGELVLPEPWFNEGDSVSIALVGPGKLLHSNGGVPQLYFIDTSDPAKPVIVHTENEKFSTCKILMVGDKLYWTGYEEDLFNIYKVDWPNKLTLLYRFNEPAVQDNKSEADPGLVITQ